LKPCDRATLRLWNLAASYLEITSPIAPEFGIRGIIVHSVPAPQHGWILVFYKYATASQLARLAACGYRRAATVYLRPLLFALRPLPACGYRHPVSSNSGLPVTRRPLAKSPRRSMLSALRSLPSPMPHAPCPLFPHVFTWNTSFPTKIL